MSINHDFQEIQDFTLKINQNNVIDTKILEKIGELDSNRYQNQISWKFKKEKNQNNLKMRY